MSVTCFVRIDDEDSATEMTEMRPRTFQELPRVGELVTFTRDGKPDADGVYRGDLFRVIEVLHTASVDSHGPSISLHVAIEQYAHVKPEES